MSEEKVQFGFSPAEGTLNGHKIPSGIIHVVVSTSGRSTVLSREAIQVIESVYRQSEATHQRDVQVGASMDRQD